jgi:excisionase family DNA binding protein
MMLESFVGVEATSSGLPAVLTVEEVAGLIRVDRKTAHAAIDEGGLPGVRRLGRCIRISRDVFLRWLEQGDGTPCHLERVMHSAHQLIAQSNPPVVVPDRGVVEFGLRLSEEYDSHAAPSAGL